MLAIHSPEVILDATQIPYATADEAFTLLRTELERFLALVETLNPDDWAKPTACTEWTVRDMLAHQAGGYASGTGYKELFRQYARKPKAGQLPEDAVNEFQLAERKGKLPVELINELRQVGPIASQKWAHQFRLFKLVHIPHPLGLLSMRHLMWVIHSRDTWMHRLDICRATGRTFEQTTGHDGRIGALVMRDVAKTVSKKLKGQAVVFDLSGVAGGVWKVGAAATQATIHMDALDFNIYASGRYSYAEARAKASLSGNVELAELALQNTVALY
ncbi:MAG: maleylpyruvate isomerase family mycothiol-dependent enzyme [Chloroflexi bacterium]|nr:maleylpyruvate isomerase family mycothiol-dependent enzyme [Chloroflexota bacterium]MBP8059993.1 maleylpyruvate isomerase family mycothiol-dependent enzyme [Chloroflexota bacterium]